MRDCYGWRARIGLIYMASSIVMEPEFAMMAPEGVSIHTTRIILPNVTVAGLREMSESPEVERSTELLAAAPLDVVIFGGTSASFLDYGWDQRIIERMRKVSGGIPATTTSTALVKGLKALGVSRVAFATPYIDEVTRRGTDFLKAHGFDVVAEKGLGLRTDHEIGDVSLDRVYRLVKETDRPEAQAVVISCTNLRTVGRIQTMEEDLRKPVVSAIQASFWDCLRLSGVREPITGFGKMLTV